MLTFSQIVITEFVAILHQYRNEWYRAIVGGPVSADKFHISVARR